MLLNFLMHLTESLCSTKIRSLSGSRQTKYKDVTSKIQLDETFNLCPLPRMFVCVVGYIVIVSKQHQLQSSCKSQISWASSHHKICCMFFQFFESLPLSLLNLTNLKAFIHYQLWIFCTLLKIIWCFWGRVKVSYPISLKSFDQMHDIQDKRKNNHDILTFDMLSYCMVYTMSSVFSHEYITPLKSFLIQDDNHNPLETHFLFHWSLHIIWNHGPRLCSWDTW